MSFTHLPSLSREGFLITVRPCQGEADEMRSIADEMRSISIGGVTGTSVAL